MKTTDITRNNRKMDRRYHNPFFAQFLLTEKARSCFPDTIKELYKYYTKLNWFKRDRGCSGGMVV